ncbi:MAG: glycosyltransferase family 4 protein [Flavobacteriales bacterium]|nr:glycosyltransferase family 4 protein [Flavobacteriales bacterium]
MRILLITDGIYPFVMGGMQKHSYYLAKFLTKKGVHVFLAHCTSDETSLKESDLPDFADFDIDRVTFKRYKFPSLDSFPGHYVRENKQYSKLIYNDLKNQLNDFDLIYCQGFTGWKFIEESKKGNLRIPVVSNLHGYEMFQKAPSLKVKLEHYLIRNIAKEISLNSDFVFSFGGKITEVLKGLGVPDEQIIESPIGIEFSWVNDTQKVENNELRKFVFIGRNERRKGIQELSKALTLLIKEKKIAFEFHFIGDISKAQQVKAENIIYHGKVVGDSKIQGILRSCDVLVVPSYSEGMPTVIMEAMASGLAIIGTDVGAISQQIGNNGWLIADSDVETIKSAIETAVKVSNVELTKRKKNSLIKVKESFLWGKVIEHKIKCFDEAINEYRSP